LGAITLQDASSLGGKAITFQAATATTGQTTDTFVGGTARHLLINNTSGTTRTVTLVTPELVETTLAVTDRTLSVPTATIWEVPALSRYNDPVAGTATITVDTVASVTYALVQGSAQA
jgi:hypothetical protein